MDTHSERVALEGGPAVPHPGDEPAGRPDPGEPLDVTVYLKLNPDTNEPNTSAAQIMERYATQCGLRVLPGPAPEAIRLSGPVSAVEDCFGVHLIKWRTADGTDAVAPDGPVYVPRSVAGDVVAVLGLDTRPVARRRD